MRARARQRLIESAALSVSGVIARRGALPRQALPSASTEVRDGRSVVNVQVAASWPADSEQITTAVRRAVADELYRSLGERPDHVRVRIARFASERTPAQVAQAYAATPADAAAEGPSGGERRRGPRGLASATVVAFLIAVALVVAGACLLRDAAVGFGWLHGSTLFETATSWIGGAHWSWWTWPAAAVAAAAGIALVVVSVVPRPRTHVLVGDGIWLPRTALGHWQDQQREGSDDLRQERTDR